MPPQLRRSLLAPYWSRFWAAEERDEQRQLGVSGDIPIRGSERAVLIEEIAQYYPFESLLEVGCGYAQNFHILARLFPDVRLAGVDRDAERISAGQAALNQRGYRNALLVQGDAAVLPEFPDRSAELVISCAMLLFVAPDKAEQTVREMYRIARRAVLLVEQHQIDSKNPAQDLGVMQPRDTGVADYYLRDYVKLFERFVPREKISAARIPNPRWNIEQWKQHGHLIAIRK